MISEEIAKFTAQIAAEIGARLIINYGYGLRGFLTRELNTQLHFTIVIQFYSRPDCQLVYDILSEEVKKYIIKENNASKKLNLGSKTNYDYYLSIISGQDAVALPDLFDIAFYEEILGKESSWVEASLWASSARLFLWPSNLPSKISLDEFKNLLNEVYSFYKEFSEQLMDYERRNILYNLEVKLFLELNLDPRSTNILQGIVKKLPEKMLRKNFSLNIYKNSVVVLLDDGRIIDEIIKALGG
ncbi:MAG: hypothetical protein QW707_06835 [Candidatus Bathyarchaeia archaeon]